MQTASLSILIPAKNIENEIPRLLSFAAVQAKELNAEFIIVDTGSSDKTVLQAVVCIKELGLHGFVIQNGDSNVPSALNTAVQKASGKYVTFLFARRLYNGFLSQYLETAERIGADIVFGCFTKDEIRTAELRALSSAVRRPNGAYLVRELFGRRMKIDIAAVLVRRSFLQSAQIDFDESCAFGYAEEFLLNCLLRAETAAQAPILLQRDEERELKRGKNGKVGFSVFGRVEALLQVRKTVQSLPKASGDLLRALDKNIIPHCVMDSVDIVLREGMNHRAVKIFLDSSGYDRLLTTDRRSNSELKQRIFVWQVAPWLYRA